MPFFRLTQYQSWFTMLNIGVLYLPYTTRMWKELTLKHSRKRDLATQNVRFAKRSISGNLTPLLVQQLRELSSRFSLSLKFGDLLLLSGGWYVSMLVSFA
jgi:hypothetical protein